MPSTSLPGMPRDHARLGNPKGNFLQENENIKDRIGWDSDYLLLENKVPDCRDKPRQSFLDELG